MKETYKSLAKSYEDLAKHYYKLSSSKELEVKKYVNSKDISIEDIRKIFGEKLKIGRSKELKKLLEKYNSQKLSDLKEEDYKTLLSDVKEI